MVGYFHSAGGQIPNYPSPTTRPNIVWITSEDNSKHYLSLFDPNGVETPHIEALARHGLQFTRAFSNAPVCSVARSTLITGAYAPRIGAQYHRKLQTVPMPQDLKMFPEYLREAGYYTTNNPKEDYNLEKSASVWDESSREASWKNRAPGQPFFHMVNIGVTHEGNLHFSRDFIDTLTLVTDERNVFVQPNHPNTEIFRRTNAYYRDRIRLMDKMVGEIVAELEDEGLMDNTFIFYFGDHGGVLPGSKGYLYETGLHVPLVVYVPPMYRDLWGIQAGEKVQGFVSFIDFAPTVLSIAGVEIPQSVDGVPFLGYDWYEQKDHERNVSYGYADRFDEKYDMVRSVRKGKYKYIRNFHSYLVDALRNNYRFQMLAYQEWEILYRHGALNETQSGFFQLRPSEMLFELESDPFETRNLAEDPAYREILSEMRQLLNQWITSMPDLSFVPEFEFLQKGWMDPVEFGQRNQENIDTYLTIANLALGEQDEVRKPLIKALKSGDPWQRYWAMNAGIVLDENNRRIIRRIRNITLSDPIPLNRAQAALYLALKKGENPTTVLLNALYNTKYPAEGLQILNLIVLMQDWSEFLIQGLASSYDIIVDTQKLQTAVREEPQVQRRLEYLGILD